MAHHAPVNRIGDHPVRPDRILRLIEWHVAAANQALQLTLQAVLALGAVRAFPRLQRQVMQITRMAALAGDCAATLDLAENKQHRKGE